MNGISNLPQFYQDIMRSPFAAAAAAAHFAAATSAALTTNTHDSTGKSMLQHSNLPPTLPTIPQSSLSHHINNQANTSNQLLNQKYLVNQMMQQHQQQQQQLFAALHNSNFQTNHFLSFRPKSPVQQSPFKHPVNDQVNHKSYMDSKQSRGRGRPKRSHHHHNTTDDVKQQQIIMSPNNSNNNNTKRDSAPSSRGESPNMLSVTSDHDSRSRSPVSKSKRLNNNNTTTSILIGTTTTTNAINTTSDSARTSTPSKLNLNQLDHEVKSKLNYTVDDISESEDVQPNGTQGDEDEVEAHTEVYSSIYDEEDDDEEEEEDQDFGNLDDLDEEAEEELDLENVNEEDMDDENVYETENEDLDLNTTATTGGTSSKLSDNHKRKNKQKTNKSSCNNSKKSISHLSKKEAKQNIANSSNNNNNKQDKLINTRPLYDFTLQALEMSLYGYLRQQQQQQQQQQENDKLFTMGHAISSIRLPPSFHHHQSPFQQQQQHKITNQSFSMFQPQLQQSTSQQPIKKDSSSSSASSSSSTSSTSSSFDSKLNDSSSKSITKKSSFSIENLLTSSCSSSSSNSSTSTFLPTKSLNNNKQQPLIDFDKLDLPDDLQIRPTYLPDLTHYGVFCKKTVISKSTRFGPFPGRVVYPNEIKSLEDNNHMWEIFNDGRLSHFIDGSRPATSSSSGTTQNQWMIYVNCARYAQEQNLIAVQFEGEIYYEVCKDIAQGQELLVWYGDSYLQFLGIPVSLKDMTDEISEETTENKDGYTCDRCGKVFAYKYYRDKHLKYTRCVDQGDRKFPCHLCTRSFEKRDRLRIHILHVHEKHRPHKCSVCGKSFSQSSSLNKHMRVHSGERPYKCVYCNKAFTASSILRTHIRQHSGEKPFKCKYCGKAFASHAAHDSHVRRTHCINKDKEANLIL